MIRFREFERLGLRLAGISGRSEGDRGMGALADGLGKAGLHALDGEAKCLCVGRQVHGVNVAVAPAADGLALIPDTDGLITNQAGCVLGVTVADCAPVYLFDPIRRALGLLHAGRAGIGQDIIASGVRRMAQEYGSLAGDLAGLVGPSICARCYEVSEDMAEDWKSADLPALGRHLDLAGACVTRLESAGLAASRITVCRACTRCSGLFYSYRGGDSTARNLAAAML